MKKDGKKKKRTFKEFRASLAEGLGEVALELIIGAVFLGIGALVYWLFGKTINWNSVDPETIMCVGVIAVTAVCVAIWIFHKLFGKKDK